MRRWGVTVVFWLGMLLFSGSASAAPTFEASPYVFRLVIGGCAHEPRLRQQTGFRVRGEAGIITALHGVADCQVINAISDDDKAQIFKSLHLLEADIDRDMALLSSDALASLPKVGLAAGNNQDIEADTLQVIGYPFGLSKQLRTPRVALTEERPLTDLIPDQYKRELQTRSSPNLEITVLRVDAHIGPGHSGAPLLTEGGLLIGVANGGLDEGRVSIGWAIPWQDVQWQSVQRLETRLAALQRDDPHLALAFSSAYPKYAVEPIQVQEVSLETLDVYDVRAGLWLEGSAGAQPLSGDMFFEDRYNRTAGQRQLEMSGSLVSAFAQQGLQQVDKMRLFTSGPDNYIMIEGTASQCLKLDRLPPEFGLMQQIFSEITATPISGNDPVLGVMVGEEPVNGTPTRHYLLDAAVFNETIQGQGLGELISGELWLTEDNFLARFDADYTNWNLPLGDQPFSGDVVMSLEFASSGADLEITIPELCRSAPLLPFSILPAAADSLPQPGLPGSNATIVDVAVQHNVVRNEAAGMSILTTLATDNLQGVPAAAVVYVFSEDGQPLRGYDPQYTTLDGAFAAATAFTPTDNPQTWYDGLETFVPYAALYLAEGAHRLSFQVVIYELSTNTILAASDLYDFMVTQPADVSGDWVGTIEYDLPGGSIYFLFGLSLWQNGDQVTGTSTISAPAPGFETAVMSLQGTVTGDTFTFQELQLLDTNAPFGYQNSGWCLEQSTLSFARDDSAWSGMSGLSGILATPGCLSGIVNLVRPDS
jgi:hypothetical protein